MELHSCKGFTNQTRELIIVCGIGDGVRVEHSCVDCTVVFYRCHTMPDANGNSKFLSTLINTLL